MSHRAFEGTPATNLLPGIRVDRYSGSASHHNNKNSRPHYHSGSFCNCCCHPVSKCCCGHRECRKESKELLAEPKKTAGDSGGLTTKLPGLADKETAIIGGGCCVHLSVEYMLLNDQQSGMFDVNVIDSEHTMLGWGKNHVEPGYHIKEGIISTNPGAKLAVGVQNVIARVRWCEVFSC